MRKTHSTFHNYSGKHKNSDFNFPRNFKLVFNISHRVFNSMLNTPKKYSLLTICQQWLMENFRPQKPDTERISR